MVNEVLESTETTYTAVTIQSTDWRPTVSSKHLGVTNCPSGGDVFDSFSTDAHPHVSGKTANRELCH